MEQVMGRHRVIFCDEARNSPVAGDRLGGVCPSSGTAMLKRNRVTMKSQANASELAAHQETAPYTHLQSQRGLCPSAQGCEERATLGKGPKREYPTLKG